MKYTQIYNRWVKASERVPIEFNKKIAFKWFDDAGNDHITYGCYKSGEYFENGNGRFENKDVEWQEEITLPEKKETAEQIVNETVLKMDAPIGSSDINRMIEMINCFANQLSTSVPISEDDFKKGGNIYDEFMTEWHTRSFDAVFSIIKKYTQPVSEEEKNVYREQGWDACWKHYFMRTPDDRQVWEDKEQFLSSFLPKKP